MGKFNFKKGYFFTVLTVLMITIIVVSGCGKTQNSGDTAQNATQNTANTLHSDGAKNGSAKLPTTAEEIAQYNGPDREKLIIEGAKKEGILNLYTSFPLEDIQKIADGFKKKYGINVNIWRANSVNVTQRIISEAQSSKPQFDVVSMSSVQIEALSREKLLQRVNTPYSDKLIQIAIPNHKEWMPVFFNVFVQAYNTKTVKKDELPKTYQDLLDPKWKGRLGLETSSYDWFSAVVKQMGEEKGVQYFKDLMKTTDPSVRTGYSVLTQMVANGEVPHALTVFSYKARQMKAEGAPIDWYAIEPAIARSTSVAISKKTAHPNSAVLFFDYMLSDAQKNLVDMYYDPANKDYQPAEKVNFDVINDQTFIDEYEKWYKLYEEIVVKRVK